MLFTPPYALLPLRCHHNLKPKKQEQAFTLKQELTVAKQEAQDALEVARKAEQQLLLLVSSSAAATQLVAAADPTTTSSTEATAPGVATTAAAAINVIAASGGGTAGIISAAATATAAAAETVPLVAGVETGADVVAAAGGRDLGLEIEKGPVSDALRVQQLKAEREELKANLTERKAELQAATGAKKKVSIADPTDPTRTKTGEKRDRVKR